MRLEAKLCRVTGFALARRIGAILVIEPPVRGHLLQGLLDTLHTLAPGMTCAVDEKRNCRRIFCDREQCRQHCKAAPGRRLTREDPAVFVQAPCGITASLLVSSFYQSSYRRLSIWLNPWTFQVTSAGERAMASPAIRGSCRQDRRDRQPQLPSYDRGYARLYIDHALLLLVAGAHPRTRSEVGRSAKLRFVDTAALS